MHHRTPLFTVLLGTLLVLGCESYPTVLRSDPEAIGNEGEGGEGGSGAAQPTGTGGQIVIPQGGSTSDGGEGPGEQPAVCGNGELEPGELCDDGGVEDGDGCSEDCAVVEDGFVCLVPGEACIDAQVCGNGLLEGEEACDDGNALAEDGCAADCLAVEAGWLCPRPDVPCVALPECGNGAIELGEECDDGGVVSGDGCTGTEDSLLDGCLLEAGFYCPAPGEACAPLVCGDGNRTPDEECDDGNDVVEDGCADDCTVEEGWRCSSSGCAPDCGDGAIVGSEDCDDGNQASGDGCSSICWVEPFWACDGEPSACESTIVCGDSEVQPGEICDPPGTDGCEEGCQSFSSEIGWEPECGNSLIEVGESCDPPMEGAGCAADCQAEPGYVCPRPGTCLLIPFCGDGIKQAGEECDVGGDASAGCVDCAVTEGWTCYGVMPSSCEQRECGDGTRTADEGCDDGNLDDEDGCSGACVVEEGWRCTSSGCTPVCGDGLLVGLEACDDGNRQRGDGCSTICRVEPFWDCAGEPSECETSVVCGDEEVGPGEICDPPGEGGCLPGCASFTADVTGAPVCGNAVIEAGETCDPPAVGLGCSALCQAEPGYVCPRPNVCILRPVCGDGIRQMGEECDVDPAHPSEGCVDCEVTEGWFCYGVQPSVCELPECGNGQREGSEECDDDDTTPTSGDGCSASCTLETGWTCPTPGAPCRPVCGDRLLRGDEQCEDDDTVPTSGDGCNAACRIEQGYDCPTIGAACVLAVCGNGIPQPGEGCDDGNAVAGDGCGPLCQDEPPVTRGRTPHVNVFCGDGMVTGEEECDDGNSEPGDGCSDACDEEAGFTCTSELPDPLPNSISFAITYRDFRGRTETAGGHPHMRPGSNPPDTGTDRNIPGTVCNTTNGGSCGRLSDPGGNYIAGVPQWVGDGSNTTVPDYTSAFSLWYRDSNPNAIAGTNGAIQIYPIADTLTLSRVSGERYQYDNSSFFVLDGRGFLNTPGTDPSHNFHFTTELRYFFQYEGGETLEFRGDDDVWVYVNGRLAVDIGGIHLPQSARVILGDDGIPSGTDSNCTTATGDNGTLPACSLAAAELADARDDRFDLTRGDVYEIVLFHAERNPVQSNFRLTLQGFLAPRSYCEPICGDGIVTGWEVCDEGTANNTGLYGHCNADCTAIQFCGDGRVNGPEVCDNGRNIDVYGTGSGRCAPGCVTPGRCGDGVLQGAFEACDLGTAGNTPTAYGPDQCTTTCELGGWCGDDIVNGSETCDDGPLNGTTYGAGSCSYDCGPGPYCGDGIRNGPEECDGGDYCNEDCTIDPYCGDGLVSGGGGEQCDWGPFAIASAEAGGTYEACTDQCLWGPRCGDGTLQEDYEECDDGADLNTGAYDACTSYCALGPYCGDAVVDVAGGEECDNGYNEDTYATGAPGECGPGCRLPAGGCGDGVLNPALEECDNGAENSDTAYGLTACREDCTIGGYCGDGVVNGGEVCDRGGLNGREYGPSSCGYDCLAGPRCGDGIRNGAEECDGTPGCSASCTLLPICGDGLVAASAGEQCDWGRFASDAYGACTDECVWGPRCGDGVRDPIYEECDLGAALNDGAYGGCNANCTLGPRCGDRVLQASQGEACDNGYNDDIYAFASNSCAPGCRLPPDCGDGIIQPGLELCDDGVNNSDTAYNGCTTSCVWGPYCGDGVLQASRETCDAGRNNTLYSAVPGGCAPDCKPAPYCGDGVRNGSELCDEGTANNDGDYGGCNEDCTRAPFCGDYVVQRDEGEECDAGPSGSLDCSPTCKRRGDIR